MTFSDIGANVNRAIVLVPFNLLLAESNLEPFYGRSQSAKFPLGRVFHIIRIPEQKREGGSDINGSGTSLATTYSMYRPC